MSTPSTFKQLQEICDEFHSKIKDIHTAGHKCESANICDKEITAKLGILLNVTQDISACIEEEYMDKCD